VSTRTKVIRIDELAKILATTPDSIRCNLKRRNFDAVPPAFKLGRRIAWTLRSVENFLEEKEREAVLSSKKSSLKAARRKKGRPTKKEQVESR